MSLCFIIFSPARYLLFDELDVPDVQLGGLWVYLPVVLAVDEGGVADVDVVDAVESLDSAGLDGSLDSLASDAVDVDALELRC